MQRINGILTLFHTLAIARRELWKGIIVVRYLNNVPCKRPGLYGSPEGLQVNPIALLRDCCHALSSLKAAVLDSCQLVLQPSRRAGASKAVPQSALPSSGGHYLAAGMAARPTRPV